MTVPELGCVTTPHEGDMFSIDQRRAAGETRERCIAAAGRESERHAGDGTCPRLVRRGKVGVRVHVSQPHRAASRPTSTQKTTEHDAAVAAQDDAETAAARGLSHPRAEGTGIDDHLIFVARTIERPDVVAIRR